jgi:hypothetical protein
MNKARVGEHEKRTETSGSFVLRFGYYHSADKIDYISYMYLHVMLWSLKDS